MKKIMLPDQLEEVSGIAWSETGIMWAIEDESSAVYIIDPNTGEIINKQKFSKNKDIEDILKINDEAWVLQSNGDLYRVKNPESEYFEVDKFDFPSSKKRDFEALIYHPQSQSILIFCKVCSWDKGPSLASVFRFDLEKMTFDQEPVLLLSRGSLSGFDIPKKTKIQPSAAAIHPFDKTIYLISSTDHWLMVLSPDLKPLEFYQLDPRIFKQSEGITFDSLGNMYISNEARDGQANLLIFPYQNE